MTFTELELPGAYIIDVDRLEDERGFFGRLWCEKEFKNFGLETGLKQANVSFNKKKGTLRGLHFQKAPYQETKLVRCTKGSIYDVIVDIRPDSQTFKQWVGAELNEQNRRMLYVPEGFAHGFLTLEDDTEVYYLVTESYNRESEGGLRYNDPELKIKWPAKIQTVSERDMKHLNFNIKNLF